MRKTKFLNKKSEGLKEYTQKGITLIALVITIIVMLILVAVTVTMAVNGGLFDYATKAGQKTNETIRQEQELANGKVKIDGKWYSSMDDYLNNKPVLTAAAVKSNLSSYLGKTVNYKVGYEDASSYGNEEWEIFYADEEHIYIITRGHLESEALETTGYNGTSDFTPDNLQSKFPAVAQGLLNKTYDPTSIGNELKYASANSNMYATQYLLDSTVWNSFANDYADWAIGGPTFELFVNSYNAYYPENIVTLEIPEGAGYSTPLYGTNAVPSGTYLNHLTSTLYWLACPSAGITSYMLAVGGGNGSVGSTDFSESFVFRPVVCLDSDIQIIWNEKTSQYDLSLVTQEEQGLETYSATKKDEKGMLTANATYLSDGYTAVIPKGFKISDIPAEQTIENGLVIEDENGNQFVWVPVKEGTFERTGWFDNAPTDKTIEEISDELTQDDIKKYLAQYNGYETIEDMIEQEEFETYEDLLAYEWSEPETEEEVEEYTIEWFESCYDWTGKLREEEIENAENDPTGEYTNMVNSVNTYGGFYIGRYEAGAQNEEGEPITRTSGANGTSQVVVKAGQYPYNYVGWGPSVTVYTGVVYDGRYQNQGCGAVYLSKNMYTDKDKYGVTSTLCYGIQWDATLKFIKDKVNVTNSTKWGNNNNSEFPFVGKYYANSKWSEKTTTTKQKGSQWLLTTGASEQNKTKNIYDLAGNLYEWTMEINVFFSEAHPALRGGAYNFSGSYDAVARRFSSLPSSCFSYYRFPSYSLYNKPRLNVLCVIRPTYQKHYNKVITFTN